MNKPAKSFQDLVVWQKAHRFVLEAYKFSGGFPKSEMYGLTSQFRRAAVSIPANIAEGFRKHSKAEKSHFLSIAQCSLEEVRYYLILAADLGYGDSSQLLTMLEEVSKLLEGNRIAIVNSAP
jgi:four helix bundle protein